MRTHSYRNGNTLVAIREDGTKYRYTPDGASPMPEYPESIDLKITDYCEENCPMCHENAGPKGCHGNLNHPVLDSIQPYTELAIGGGNPMSHPGLYGFLQRMMQQKVICNITVHWNQFTRHKETLRHWQQDNLIHGIGVSINQPVADTSLLESFPHLVVHTIAGVADSETYRSLADKDLNLLILGYKEYGRGITYHDEHKEVERKLQWVRNHVIDLSDHFRSICFDDLSVRQLGLKDKLTDKAWDQFYMGGEGKFTMYVDLVKGEYAASSASERKRLFSDDIRKMFTCIL